MARHGREARYPWVASRLFVVGCAAAAVILIGSGASRGSYDRWFLLGTGVICAAVAVLVARPAFSAGRSMWSTRQVGLLVLIVSGGAALCTWSSILAVREGHYAGRGGPLAPAMVAFFGTLAGLGLLVTGRGLPGLDPTGGSHSPGPTAGR